MGGGVTICRNVSIKICPNWAEEGRVKANWDNAMSLNLGVFLTAFLLGKFIQSISQYLIFLKYLAHTEFSLPFQRVSFASKTLCW